MIDLNTVKKLIAIVLAAALLALTAGCGLDLQNGTSSSSASESITPSSAEGVQPTDAAEQSTDETESPADTTYTMADIKKLKNTERFAKNTLEHIFDGTINGKGKATGYHYTMVTDSKGKVIEGTRSDVDENGVFTGKVEVNGVRKDGFSSFFPESWSPQQIVDAINTAYDDAINHPSNPKGSLWIGYCGDLEIDMYLNANKKITSAFPIYEGD